VNEDYCLRYGFDAQSRSTRLALLELGETDHALAAQLQEAVLSEEVLNITERFYEHLYRFPDIMRVLGSEERIAELKRTQIRYLLTLGTRFDSADYFADRLRIGEVHAHRNVSLAIYQSTYRLMQQLIVDAINDRFPDDARTRRALRGFALKITNLDMSLAIETYHNVQVADLRESVDFLHHEGLRLREKVERDTLTGVATRGYILNELGEALPASFQRHSPMCLVIVDIDHFKQINDSYGHLAGDVVLQVVARRLEQCVREFDMVGRYGGEEFLVVLEDTHLDTGRRIAERLRAGVAAETVECNGNAVQPTISLGLTQAVPSDDVRSIIERADDALYTAKEEGRNRVVVL